MNLSEWAIRHHISIQALVELRQMMIGNEDATVADYGISESAVASEVRLEASVHGGRLWRNNVGAGMLENGSFVRWGLANDSKAINDTIKSSDLIGIKPVLIEHRHVGSVVGQFVAREIKRPDWKFSNTQREVAQLRFIELIVALGGDACFATGMGTFK